MELGDEELGRFSRLRKIGGGGFGVVFEADDPHYGCRVALKLLRTDRLDSLDSFKREFRSLADIAHPNLVRLYDLGRGAESFYFTMELVDGVPFSEYVWGTPATDDGGTQADAPPDTVPTDGRPKVDPDRLVRAAAQLVDAVQALHDARKLHCDLKPSNVLVTKAGRVVVLDFGLVADLDRRDQTAKGAAGTPGYMAPEQAERREISPATDWYAVGAMLFEALTGKLPFRGTNERWTGDPTLERLFTLALDLLAEEPHLRPSADAIRSHFKGDLAAERTAIAEPPRDAFIGREPELRALREAADSVTEGRPVVMRVIGPSGIGKSALVQRFLRGYEASEEAALVLSGRCYEQESVPYKALDGVMDALGAYLGGLSKAEGALLLPPGSAPLAQLFPVLAPVVATRKPEAHDKPTQAERLLAFQALRELLVRIGKHRKLVLALDDLHCGDLDSARLLAELLRPPHAPTMLVVASYRPDPSPDGFVAALGEALAEVEQRSVELSALSREEARAMAQRLLGDDLEALVEPVAREGSGHPIFILQLAEQARVSRTHEPSFGLGEVINERVRGLEPDARQLLEAVAIAGHPIAETVALRAAQLDGAQARKAASTIRNARFVISRGGELDVVHDRLREVIAASTTDDRTRGYHGRLAEALIREGQTDPEALARHYRGAGDSRRTREYTLKAAARADNAFAFDQAAHHYETVLELTEANDPERWKIAENWGEALANAGRGGAAGDAFQQAAEALAERAPDRVEVVSLWRRAGEHTLRSGRLELGAQRMKDALRRVGVSMPESRTTAGVLAAGRRLKLFVRGLTPKRRDRRPATGAELARLDALWAASTGVSMVNHVLADALGLQHLLATLEIDAGSHLIRGLGYEAAFEAVIGGPLFRHRCGRILNQMQELAASSNTPYDIAWASQSKGVTSWFLGDWVASWTHCDEAAEMYRERCRGVAWELAICDAYRLPSLAYIGDLQKLTELVPRALQGAHDRGDLYAASMLRLGQQSMVPLAANRPEEALRDAHQAIASFSTDTYLLPHYHYLFARAQADLYRGEVGEAWSHIERDWPGLGQSSLLMVQCLRVEIRHLRARLALALAREGGGGGALTPARLRKEALKEAKTIAKDDVAPAAPLACAIRAAVAHGEGRHSETERLLTDAVHGFRRASMFLYAEAARERLGALRGGDEGRTMQTEARAWMSSKAIVDPSSMVAMLLPGV